MFAFDMRMRQEILKREIRNNRLLGMANYNTYFKNNFNLLVINVKKISFIFLQNLHIWHLSKVLQITTIKYELKLLNISFTCFSTIKGTLMQIWKSPHISKFVKKWYPKDSAFLIVRIRELFTRKDSIFLKK